MADPTEMFTVAIRAADIETLHTLVQTMPLDYGCRPMVRPTGDGRVETVAYATPSQLDNVRSADYEVVVISPAVSADRAATHVIGSGDRFQGGALVPQGLGSNPDLDLGGILNAEEINSAITGLVNEYGISTFDTPNQTAEGAGGRGGLVGGVNPDDYHVYFTAGVHARERGGPDNLIYFIADLLFAQKHGTGLQYGAKSFSNAEVLRALGTGIVFFPLVNPDGVRWDQQTDSLWRKNRNPASATPGDPRSIGVDINRNYDFLWDYRRYFDPSTYSTSDSLASDRPGADTFHGLSPFSEPETRNVAWVFDAFPRIRWYMDIHSAVGDILYPWGDDADQTQDPGQRFLNVAFDGQRGVVPAQDYREWIEEAELARIAGVAERTSTTMQAVGGSSYSPMQAASLYATSGSSDDYAFSRTFSNPGLNKVYSFTMEFGPPFHFYPTPAEFRQNVLDVGAGLVEFCLAAADIGVV
jgi:murein tripeptide amidase MpaA